MSGPPTRHDWPSRRGGEHGLPARGERGHRDGHRLRRAARVRAHLPQEPARLPANIALLVNTALLDWLKRNPAIRVRTVLPVTQDGQTTAIHLWYDRADGVG